MTKNILIAPLNWGLGHATRCIPIIRVLEHYGFTPVLASDGEALQLLQKEFPHLPFVTLPSYDIEYAKEGSDFKWKLIKNSPKMIQAIFEEKKMVKKLTREWDLKGIISDNRLGVYSKKVPSVFITHQLNVLSGKTTWISSKLHQYFIKKFTECWIPDMKNKPNLTGKLGHLKNNDLPLKYLGPLSRLEKRETAKHYELMVILSGPEPQRTLLEEKLIIELQRYNGSVIFIKGKVAPQQTQETIGHITYYNFMTSDEIEQAYNESEMVLCRSGYTTVMDLAKLQKNAFFIPTPGQFEQEYLAKRFQRNGYAPFAEQEHFRIENLLEMGLYKGLPKLIETVNWKQLFILFEGK
ncbi:glycosyltransferase [Flavobacterium sedimenticola]|uniref:Glycosyltransferase n=1 Tax=Flavobacterium sedimenticola TaxID=3043286 RepID=A0ABT6XNN0_9FLAO|nr:glycosyltransferase [Flavobacterium sedimenticola]MDI9256442.1 glycosyltransferase [Flavobacterium sedimenticola]